MVNHKATTTSGRVRDVLVQALRSQVDLRVVHTERRGHAAALAEQAAADGLDVVVALGGDGTVNEVVNGLAGSKIALGLLPIGTVNVFAMELGLPSHNLELCWDVIQGENERLADLPSANGKYFVQLAGVGLDAQVVK